MASAFSRTSRSLERDLSENTALYFLIALLLLGAWGGWALLARIPLFAGSSRGRLEITTTTHRTAVLSPGRIAGFSVRLGDRVTAQQVLLALDDTVERRRLDEARANVSALALRVRAVQTEREAEQQVRAWQSKVLAAGLAQSRASLAEISGELIFKRRQAEMAERLHQEALLSESDTLIQVQGLSKTLHQITSAQASLEREQANGQHADKIQVAKISSIERQLAELEALRVAGLAAVETAEAEVEKRLVRAPVTGRIGSVASIQSGDVLDIGNVVATVVPDDPLRVVAEFDPVHALGRIQRGQSARVRLTGFSLVEIGRFYASVTEVASEPQNGMVRVELRMSDRPTDQRLRHGVPASVEVSVDSASPWELVLRTLGNVFDSEHDRHPVDIHEPTRSLEAEFANASQPQEPQGNAP